MLSTELDAQPPAQTLSQDEVRWLSANFERLQAILAKLDGGENISGVFVASGFTWIVTNGVITNKV